MDLGELKQSDCREPRELGAHRRCIVLTSTGYWEGAKKGGLTVGRLGLGNTALRGVVGLHE